VFLLYPLFIATLESFVCCSFIGV